MSKARLVITAVLVADWAYPVNATSRIGTPSDVNGSRVLPQILVDRVRDPHRGLANLDYEGLERVDAPGRCA